MENIDNFVTQQLQQVEKANTSNEVLFEVYMRTGNLDPYVADAPTRKVAAINRPPQLPFGVDVLALAERVKNELVSLKGKSRKHLYKALTEILLVNQSNRTGYGYKIAMVGIEEATSEEFLYFFKDVHIRHGINSAMVRAFKEWYLLKEPRLVIADILDVPRINGMTHFTVVKKCHPKPATEAENEIYRIALSREVELTAENGLYAFTSRTLVEDPHACISAGKSVADVLCNQSMMSYHILPKELKENPDFIMAYLNEGKLSIADFYRNLETMESKGFFKAKGATNALIQCLEKDKTWDTVLLSHFTLSLERLGLLEDKLKDTMLKLIHNPTKIQSRVLVGLAISPNLNIRYSRYLKETAQERLAATVYALYYLLEDGVIRVNGVASMPDGRKSPVSLNITPEIDGSSFFGWIGLVNKTAKNFKVNAISEIILQDLIAHEAKDFDGVIILSPNASASTNMVYYYHSLCGTKNKTYPLFIVNETGRSWAVAGEKPLDALDVFGLDDYSIKVMLNFVTNKMVNEQA